MGRIHDRMILLCANMCPKSSISDIYIIDVVFCCVSFLYVLLRGFIMFAVWFLFSFFFFCSRFYLVVKYFRYVFLVYILFGEFLCSISNNIVSKKKKKFTQKINKIKTPVNFSFAACGMEKIKIRVEYVIFCVLLVNF